MTDLAPLAKAESGRRRALLALLLLVPVPSLAVLCAMVWEPTRGTMLGQIIYGAAKVSILALPVVWRIFVERKPISWSPLREGGLGAGLITGAFIAACIYAGYWFVGRDLIDPQLLREVTARNRLDQPLIYLGLVLYLTLVNSLLEEFVWRWFAYEQCERLMPPWLAVVLSALLFTLHHVIALYAQFNWPITLLASAGLFIGGVAWSWLYRRYRSIWPGYLSHICADAAVFTIGWMLLFGQR